MVEKEQTKEFKSESYRYISSYVDIETNGDNLFPKSIDADCVENLLDVGCGTGHYLNAWKNKYSVSNAIGIETSNDGVALLNKKWNNEEDWKI